MGHLKTKLAPAATCVLAGTKTSIICVRFRHRLTVSAKILVPEHVVSGRVARYDLSPLLVSLTVGFLDRAMKLQKIPDDLRIVLDISRLIARIKRSTPTGIDRVVLAYAKELRHRTGTEFAILDERGMRLVPNYLAQALLTHLEASWSQTAQHSLTSQIAATVFARPGVRREAFRFLTWPPNFRDAAVVYLNVCHRNWGHFDSLKKDIPGRRLSR